MSRYAELCRVTVGAVTCRIPPPRVLQRCRVPVRYEESYAVLGQKGESLIPIRTIIG